jgi:hypothetical protein
LTSIVLPEGLTDLGGYVFSNSGLTAVTIPASLKNLAFASFSQCTALKSVSFAGVPRRISGEAFAGCTKLTSVTLPATITHIGVDAFRGCARLTSVYITDMAAWCAIDFDNAYANPLYKATSLYLNGTKVTSVSIPSGVTEIAPFAFYGFKGITSVTIPASVTVIDSYAFTNCTALTTVTFSGTGLTDIRSYAFAGCTALNTIVISKYTTSIGEGIFTGCSALTVYAPKGSAAEKTASLNNYSFEACDYNKKAAEVAS